MKDVNQKSLTIDAILESVEKFRGCMPPDPFGPISRPSRLFGMKIVEVPVFLEQKIKLRDDAPVSDEFRSEFDTWLLQMFGTRDASPVRPGMAYLFGNTIFMRPEEIVKLNCC